MPLPNFLIFGVQKAGTTSIYDYLAQHPQVFTSDRKETEFLGRQLTDGVPTNGEHLNRESTPGGRKQILTLDDYAQLFEGVTDEIAIGEASPNYLFLHEQAVPNIQTYVPDAKLIAILRNPIERAYSDYLMHIRQVVGNQKTLEEQVRNSPTTSYTLLKGLYYKGTKHFLDTFGPDQVKIFLYDDLRKDANQLMRNVYRFLGVNPDYSADTQRRYQTAQVPKNQAINKLLRTENPLRSVARTVLRTVVPEETRQKLRSRLIAANSSGKDSVPLSAETRQLLCDYYREDVAQLQDLIGRDLSHWCKARP